MPDLECRNLSAQLKCDNLAMSLELQFSRLLLWSGRVWLLLFPPSPPFPLMILKIVAGIPIAAPMNSPVQHPPPPFLFPDRDLAILVENGDLTSVLKYQSVVVSLVSCQGMLSQALQSDWSSPTFPILDVNTGLALLCLALQRSDSEIKTLADTSQSFSIIYSIKSNINNAI